jgi:hypothetical protein
MKIHTLTIEALHQIPALKFFHAITSEEAAHIKEQIEKVNRAWADGRITYEQLDKGLEMALSGLTPVFPQSSTIGQDEESYELWATEWDSLQDEIPSLYR